MRKILYISIADFGIKMIFEPSLIIQKQKQIIDVIQKQYNIFLKKKIKNAEVVIKITDRDEGRFFYTKDKRAFIEFYKNENGTIHAYYDFFPLYYILRDKISFLLKSKGGMVLHASAVETKEHSAVIFCGPSGEGKSTIIQLLNLSHFAIADEAIVIRNKKNSLAAYQTPFSFKEAIINKVNKSKRVTFPVKYIYFLKKSKQYGVVDIHSKLDLRNRLIQNSHIKINVKKNKQLIENALPVSKIALIRKRYSEILNLLTT